MEESDYKRVRFVESYSTPLRKLTFPVLEISGKKPGPKLSIVAGINGTQYCGALACLRLFEEIESDKLRGKLKLIPVANPQGFDQKERYAVPVEDDFNGIGNLNRIMPGDTKGSPPRALARSVFEEILTSDYLVDIHGGDSLEDILPSVMYTLVASRNPRSKLAKIDEETKKLALSTGLEWVIEALCDISKRGRIHVEACFKEIPSINVEVAKSGEIDEEYCRTLKMALYNVMSYLGMVVHSEEPKARWISSSKERKYITDLTQVRAKVGGFFQTSVQVADTVSARDPIGQVIGLDGDIKQDVLSPIDGVVVERRTNPVVDQGDIVCEVGVFELR